MAETIHKDILIRIRSQKIDTSKLKHGMGSITTATEEVRKKVGRNMTEVTKTIKKNGNVVSKLTSTIEDNRVRFQGWALSIMFAGMIIQRVFTNLLKASTATFLRIAEGTTTGSRAIIALSAAWEFLKFTIGKVIGQALAPLIPKIIEIVKKLAEWINKHPKLTAAIILGGIALGFFLMLIGQVVLFLSGLREAIDNTIWVFRGLWKAALSPQFWLVVAAIVLLAILIYAIIQVVKNWGKDWAKTFKWMGIAVLALAAIIGFFFGGWLVALILAIVAVVLIAVGFIIQYWTEIKTFFIELWTSIWTFIVEIWTAIIGFFTTVFTAIYDVFASWWAVIADIFAPIIEGIKLLWTALVGFFTALWELVKAVFQLALDWIKYLVTEYIIEPLMALWGVVAAWFDANVLQPLIALFTSFWEWIVLLWNDIVLQIQTIILPIVLWFQENIIQPIADAWQWLQDFVSGVFDKIVGWAKSAIEWVGKALEAAAKIVGIGTEKVKGATAAVKSAGPPSKGKKQFGGEIMSDGLYQLEKGERVVPTTNNTTNMGGINVTVNTTGGVNAAAIADQIASELKRRIPNI